MQPCPEPRRSASALRELRRPSGGRKAWVCAQSTRPVRLARAPEGQAWGANPPGVPVKPRGAATGPGQLRPRRGMVEQFS